MQPSYLLDQPTSAVSTPHQRLQGLTSVPTHGAIQRPIRQQAALASPPVQQTVEPEGFATRQPMDQPQTVPAQAQQPVEWQATPVLQPTEQGQVPVQQQPPQQQPPQQQPLQQQPPQQSPQLAQGAALQQPATAQSGQLPQQPARQPIQSSAQLQGQAPMSVQPGQLPQSEPGREAGQLQARAGSGPASSPFVDIIDSPTEITVFVDLPGCDEEDIQLQASGNTLHVTANRPERVGDEERPLQRERPDRIERDIALPVQIDVEEARASCEEGVCEISLPKSEETKQKSIGFQ